MALISWTDGVWGELSRISTNGNVPMVIAFVEYPHF